MLKMALLDCAINEKCCSVDEGGGICPLFSSPPQGIWQLKSPHPREFALPSKALGGWIWLMHNSGAQSAPFINWINLMPSG